MKNLIATSVRNEGDKTIVRYHDTDIFVYDHDSEVVELDHGGWGTALTKRRINQAFEYFGIDAKLYQENWVWYIKGPNDSWNDIHDDWVTVDSYGLTSSNHKFYLQV